MRHFMELLQARWAEGKFLCVGLDPDIAKIPSKVAAGLSSIADIIVDFNIHMIEATKDMVCAYKPNAAFFEAHGFAGWQALSVTMAELRRRAPDVPVILDAKRADIGNTNEGYARGIFDDLGADAVTVHPYLGGKALEPFLTREEKGVIVLCRTSNPDAGEFQDIEVGDGRLYQYVAKRVAEHWNTKGNCALVVGATYPSELRLVRDIVGTMPILIPGVGKQGGDLAAAVRAGWTEGVRIIVNSSRDILYASSGDDFKEAARTRATGIHMDIHAAIGALTAHHIERKEATA